MMWSEPMCCFVDVYFDDHGGDADAWCAVVFKATRLNAPICGQMVTAVCFMCKVTLTNHTHRHVTAQSPVHMVMAVIAVMALGTAMTANMGSSTSCR